MSKHSANKAVTLPWPSGMSLPTMNFPSFFMLSMELSYDDGQTSSHQMHIEDGGTNLHAVRIQFTWRVNTSIAFDLDQAALESEKLIVDGQQCLRHGLR